MRDPWPFVIGFTIGALAVFSLMCFLAVADHNKWRRDSIEHDAAYYHPETGEFTWKEDN